MRQMARIVILGLILFVAWGVVSYYRLPTTNNRVQISPTPQKDPNILKTEMYKVENNQKVVLISNLEEKLSAKDLSQNHNCLAGVNGGFYGQDNKFIGLVVIDGNIVSEYQQNRLFNGIISYNTKDQYRIDDMTNETNWEWALQTGPILMKNGVKAELSLSRDEPARRMVAAINQDNQLILLTVYNTASVYEGPKLAELPEVIFQVNRKNDWKIVNAINLDGGTASGWISPESELPEFNRVGSWLCVQQKVSGIL